MSSSGPSYVLRAIASLQAFDRRGAAALLRQEIADGGQTGRRWRAVAQLAGKIGEVEIAIEAARRYAATDPTSLDHQLFYWGELATHGRHAQALGILAALSPGRGNHPAVLHFKGTIAAQEGEFELAEQCYRRALAQAPLAPQTWFALAMIKTFAPGDADLVQMERLRPSFTAVEPSIYARFLFGLGKARHDCGDYDRAFEAYTEGSALRRREEPYNAAALAAFVDGLIRDFTAEGVRSLNASGCESSRPIFVNGVPRSGTTLVEQILTSHSTVSAGAELNLLAQALIPTGDYSFAGAARYQGRSDGPDCWGQIGADYLHLLQQRFGSDGRLVDKTLSQSHLMGLLLHVLPNAKIIWLRRAPEDSALSTFRSFFTAPTPWCWSLEDIAHFYRQEDRLYRHWTELAPDRILTVQYEELVRNPEEGIRKILGHVGLAPEPQVFEPHKSKRSVRTASVKQVRAPITSASVGAAKAYDTQMEAFRRAYRG